MQRRIHGRASPHAVRMESCHHGGRPAIPLAKLDVSGSNGADGLGAAGRLYKFQADEHMPQWTNMKATQKQQSWDGHRNVPPWFLWDIPRH